MRRIIAHQSNPSHNPILHQITALASGGDQFDSVEKNEQCFDKMDRGRTRKNILVERNDDVAPIEIAGCLADTLFGSARSYKRPRLTDLHIKTCEGYPNVCVFLP